MNAATFTLMQLLRLAALVCLVAVPAWPQLPPAPADGVYDDTRALSEGSHQQLAKEIRSFREREGMDAWFAATTFLPEGQTLRSEARLLRQAWSGTRPALLLLYDRSQNQDMVTFSPSFGMRCPPRSSFRSAKRCAT